MSKTKLEPDKINSPIQLMAAWFVMLIVLSGVLLTAASQVERPSWAAGYLVVFTSIVIILVLGCVLLMLTKYRPHLQEGEQYAEWLKDQNRYSEGIFRPRQEIIDQSEVFEEQAKLGSTALRQYVNVTVLSLPNAGQLVSRFTDLGFTSEVYDSEYNEEKEFDAFEQGAIWLGSIVPTNLALEIIIEAMKLWPHLRYIHLSSDSGGPEYTHRQVFLGGSTNTAVDRYQLDEWSLTEIEQIDDEISVEEFHQTIRSKYP